MTQASYSPPCLSSDTLTSENENTSTRHAAPPPPKTHGPGRLRLTCSAPTTENAQPGLQRRTPKVSWVPHVVTAQGLWCWAFPPLPSSARRCSTTYRFNVKGSTNNTSNTQSPRKEKEGRKVSSVLVRFRQHNENRNFARSSRCLTSAAGHETVGCVHGSHTPHPCFLIQAAQFFTPAGSES